MPSSITHDHARHDQLLIAGHAAGDLSDTDRASADALIASCQSCADVRRDLVAIAAATRSLPAPARLRDFQLEAEQAARLRRGSWLRGLLRPFAASSSPVRPMAAALSSLGLAGLFVATVLPGLFGSAAGPAMELDTTLQPQAAPAATTGAAVGAPGGEFGGIKPEASDHRAHVAAGASAPPDAEGNVGKVDDGATAPLAAAGGDQTNEPGDVNVEDSAPLRQAAEPRNLVVAGSLALLGIGLLLFGLRLAARRLR
jgi:anti-sigma factor RsiW